ncbi:MAG: uncharacterized protein KVP18_003129 [Porospora cf. gigantea A]|uniref:uncharacterized protein n=2 Tax=Porospora cf. gigantea A TaxID=2853593 RepID=UPI0035599266|nr:MAG: hypothetical protein KVP18_003129 [Porospora cf. gigantea A]
MQLATAMLTTEFVPTCVTEKQNRMHRNIISSECTTTAMESGDLPIETTAGVADQLRSGFGLIQTAFQLHRKSAVEEINDLKSKYENLKIHDAHLQKRLSESEAAYGTLIQQHNLLKDEHKRLYVFCENLQKKIQKLESIRSAVLSTIQNDSSEEATIDGKYFHSTFNLSTSSPNKEVSPSVEMSPPSKFVRDFAANEDCSKAGKHFFRHAKGRMSVDRFAELIGTVKQLNRGELSTPHVIDRAPLLFGAEHAELADEFRSLLMMRLEKEERCRHM